MNHRLLTALFLLAGTASFKAQIPVRTVAPARPRIQTPHRTSHPVRVRSAPAPRSTLPRVRPVTPRSSPVRRVAPRPARIPRTHARTPRIRPRRTAPTPIRRSRSSLRRTHTPPARGLDTVRRPRIRHWNLGGRSRTIPERESRSSWEFGTRRSRPGLGSSRRSFDPLPRAERSSIRIRHSRKTTPSPRRRESSLRPIERSEIRLGSAARPALPPPTRLVDRYRRTLPPEIPRKELRNRRVLPPATGLEGRGSHGRNSRRGRTRFDRGSPSRGSGGTTFITNTPVAVAIENDAFRHRGGRRAYLHRSYRSWGFGLGFSFWWGGPGFYGSWLRWCTTGYYLPWYYDWYWGGPGSFAWSHHLSPYIRLHWRDYWLNAWWSGTFGLFGNSYYDPWTWAWADPVVFAPASRITIYEGGTPASSAPASSPTDSTDAPSSDTPNSRDLYEDSSPRGLARRYVELGDLYFRTLRYSRAAAAYASAVKLLPEDGSLRLVLGDAWFAVGKYDEAAFAIRQAFFLDESLGKALVDKRNFYGRSEDFDKHLAALRKRVAANRYDTNAALVLLYNLRFSHRFDEAAKLADSLEELLPGDRAFEILRDSIPEVRKALEETPPAPPGKKESKTKSETSKE